MVRVVKPNLNLLTLFWRLVRYDRQNYILRVYRFPDRFEDFSAIIDKIKIFEPPPPYSSSPVNNKTEKMGESVPAPDDVVHDTMNSNEYETDSTESNENDNTKVSSSEEDEQTDDEQFQKENYANDNHIEIFGQRSSPNQEQVNLSPNVASGRLE